MCHINIFPQQEYKCNNARFHKTALARTSHGNAATQIRCILLQICALTISDLIVMSR